MATPVLSLPLDSPGIGRDTDDSELAEYVVPVRWRGTVPEHNATGASLLWRRTSVWPFDDARQVVEICDWLETRGGMTTDHSNDKKRGRG